MPIILYWTAESNYLILFKQINLAMTCWSIYNFSLAVVFQPYCHFVMELILSISQMLLCRLVEQPAKCCVLPNGTASLRHAITLYQIQLL